MLGKREKCRLGVITIWRIPNEKKKCPINESLDYRSRPDLFHTLSMLHCFELSWLTTRLYISLRRPYWKQYLVSHVDNSIELTSGKGTPYIMFNVSHTDSPITWLYQNDCDKIHIISTHLLCTQSSFTCGLFS